MKIQEEISIAFRAIKASKLRSFLTLVGIVIGITTVIAVVSVINGMNKRIFEATGCGAFVLVKYRHALDELYEVGKEVVAYTSYDDLIKKIDYYLEHDEERKKIAEAGYKRAHKDHTLEIRLKSMFKTLFG